MKTTPLNIKWCGNVCQWGHFRALGLQSSERLEYKEYNGELKRVDPEFSLSLSLSLSLSPLNSNIDITLGEFINLNTFSKEVNIICMKWVYCDIGM
jgi:hypothetical protein